MEKVPLAPFQEAFKVQSEKHGLSLREVAERSEMDYARVRKLLLGKSHRSRKYSVSGEEKNFRSTQTRVTRPVALKLATALNLDPWEVGL